MIKNFRPVDITKIVPRCLSLARHRVYLCGGLCASWRDIVSPALLRFLQCLLHLLFFILFLRIINIMVMATKYTPDDPRYITDSGMFNSWLYYWDRLLGRIDGVESLPERIGGWIGMGTDAYTESSTEFERDWNSYENQMDRAIDAGLNPYELFASGSLNNGSVSTSAVDPMSNLASYLSSFISFANGLADVRSKNIANKESLLDLKRKMLEDEWYYGSPGQKGNVGVDSDGNPVVTVYGRRPSVPEIRYKMLDKEMQSVLRRENGERYNALKYGYKISRGDYVDEADYEKDRAYYERMNSEYNAKRNKLSYEWESFLKDELGLDPRTAPWLTSFMKILDNQSQNDSPLGRFLFGLLQFLKGDY